VALMVSRGQSSATFLWNASKSAEQAWHHNGAETFVYALYDRDAGGRRAARTIERDLSEHAPGVPIHFELLAVTDDQISAWDLPTRPAKASDPEAATFDGRAVELDAIPPDKLRNAQVLRARHAARQGRAALNAASAGRLGRGGPG